ncbi:MAG: F0F1 ATP synthase subunit B [Acidobacteriota bacterium]
MSRRRILKQALFTLSACAVASGAFAAGGGDGEHHGPSLIAKIVNTAIFFGFIAYMVGPSIKAHFIGRKKQIAEDLQAAQRAREEAEAKLAEIDARLKEVETEVGTIRSDAEKTAAAERERLIAEAEAEAGRIVAQAERQAADLESGAERQLREKAADMAVEMASQVLSKELKDDDHGRLFNQYVDGLTKAAS